MSEEQVAQERPCLHCMMVDLIDDFFAEYPATAGGSDKVDTDEADELIGAIAKTVAELTSRQDGTIRQQLIEELMREIMNYDAEFRREDAAGADRVSCAALDAIGEAFARRLGDPPPCLDRPGVGLRIKGPLDLSQRVRTYLFDRHSLIRGRW